MSELLGEEKMEGVARDLSNLNVSESKPETQPIETSVPSDSSAAGASGDAASVDASTPCNFDLYKAEGNLLVKAEKYSEALEKYDLAWDSCRTDDDRAMILNNRGVVFEKMGVTEKALEIFKEALEIKPEYIKVLLRRSLIHKKMKNFELAIEDLSEAHVLALKNHQTLAGLPESIGALILEYTESEMEKLCATRTFAFPKASYIQTYFRGFYCDPVSRMWRGLDTFPVDELKADQRKITGYLEAIACMRSQEFSAVPDHCSTEIENPDGSYRMEALLLRGSMYFLCGDCAGALADFQAVADDPNASDQLKSCAHLKAGLCQNLWGSCEDTAMHFSKAEQFWAQNGDVYYHASVTLVEKGEVIPALALLEKGAEECAEPKQYPLLHVLRLSIKTSYDACVYSNSNAMDTLVKLKEMERNGVFDTPECYEIYAQALLVLSETGEDAFEMFDKAAELSGGCKIFHLKKVMANLMKTDDREETLKTLEVFAKDPDTASTAYYHIGEINMLMQNFDEGFAAIEKSIEFSNSIYDAKVRVMGKIDFKYNARVAEKMKLYKVDLFGQADEANKALE